MKEQVRRQAWTPLEAILGTGLLAVCALQFFYFVLIPQNWTLRDDYSFVVEWTRPGSDQWAMGWHYLKTIMTSGRFQPVDALSRVLHYRYLPVTPRSFHLSYFALAAVALGAVAGFLKQLGLGRARVFLALLLIVSNLAFKEWLTTLTVSESWATTFLMVALLLYASGRRWWALAAFALSCFSKESFFLFAGVFPLLELYSFKSRPRDLGRMIPALGILAFTCAFIIFVRTLPQGYSGGLSFSKLSIGAILTSLALPPLKSFGPALLFLAFAPKALQTSERALALVGLWCIVPFTLLINAWGPFDSWFYLHTAIPFGWAFLIAALWRPNGSRAEAVVAVLSIVYLILSTANGGRNTTGFFAGAKTAAQIACEDSERVPGLTVYSNCNEGSHQLEQYLRLARVCASPPEIHYLGGANGPSTATPGPFELLISSKCDSFDLGAPGLRQRHQLKLEAWTVIKSF